MPADLSACFDLAISLNSRTFAAEHYETAYHALMAALHCAIDLKDEARLRRVAQLATEQGDHIDSVSPMHRLSSQCAKARGHHGIYELAAKQAKAHAEMLHLGVRPDQQDDPQSNAPREG